MRFIRLLKQGNNFETLWTHFTTRKRTRARFANFIGKHQAVDSFLSSLWRPGRPKGRYRKTEERLAKVDRSKVGAKPTIVYGDGRFGPGGRGEQNVPTVFMKRRVSLQYKLVMVDEYFTSKACFDCHKTLVPAFRIDERGLVSVTLLLFYHYIHTLRTFVCIYVLLSIFQLFLTI